MDDVRLIRYDLCVHIKKSRNVLRTPFIMRVKMCARSSDFLDSMGSCVSIPYTLDPVLRFGYKEGLRDRKRGSLSRVS